MTAQGVGIGLRPQYGEELMETERQVDFLEFIPENYVGRGGKDRRVLYGAAERWPLLCHGVSVSAGSPDPLDREYLDQLRPLLHDLGVPRYTDHLCFTAVGGFQSHQLVPLPFSAEAVRHAAARIRQISEVLELPVAVENVTYYAVMPGTELGHAAFVRAVCEEADCGLLLDVNNLFINCSNHGADLQAELDQLPLDRVCHIHIAGHVARGRRLIDHHGAPTSSEVLDLYAEVVRRLGDVPTLLERDTNIPPLDEVLDEADAIRAVQREVLS